MRATLLNTFIVFAITLFTQSCGSDAKPTSTTSCQTGSALIHVLDASLTSLCGCSEGVVNTVQGQDFTCTVSKGTVVTFKFDGAQLQHQITPVTAKAFLQSDVFDPQDSSTIVNHSVTFSSSGTFSFKDKYNPSLAGSIIVP